MCKFVCCKRNRKRIKQESAMFIYLFDLLPNDHPRNPLTSTNGARCTSMLNTQAHAHQNKSEKIIKTKLSAKRKERRKISKYIQVFVCWLSICDFANQDFFFLFFK